MKNTSRRDFIKASSMAAAALAGGCATTPVARKAAWKPDENAFIKSVLLHLGSAMWTDVKTPLQGDKKPAERNWDSYKARKDYMQTTDAMWREFTDAARDHGFNMVVIDIGEALAYPSHPELAVRGTWSVDKMRRELDRLREIGLEPIPKLNFSTTHNAWMREWRHKVSSPEYLDTVDDLIRDVAEVFDHPRLFHIGYDEESIGHQGDWGRYEYIVVRRGKLWWHDFLRCVAAVREVGSRAWCFSDRIWKDHDAFVENMPRDVVMCPWSIPGEKDPESVHNTCIGEMARLGFDLIPMISTYSTKNAGISEEQPDFASAYCEKTIPKSQLKGYIFGPWTLTAPGVPRDKYMASLPVMEKMFKRFGH